VKFGWRETRGLFKPKYFDEHSKSLICVILLYILTFITSSLSDLPPRCLLKYEQSSDSCGVVKSQRQCLSFSATVVLPTPRRDCQGNWVFNSFCNNRRFSLLLQHREKSKRLFIFICHAIGSFSTHIAFAIIESISCDLGAPLSSHERGQSSHLSTALGLNPPVPRVSYVT
jgi:hypothetical protein